MGKIYANHKDLIVQNVQFLNGVGKISLAKHLPPKHLPPRRLARMSIFHEQYQKHTHLPYMPSQQV